MSCRAGKETINFLVCSFHWRPQDPSTLEATIFLHNFLFFFAYLIFSSKDKKRKKEACDAVNSKRSFLIIIIPFFTSYYYCCLIYNSISLKKERVTFLFFFWVVYLRISSFFHVAEVLYLFSYKFADGHRPGHAWLVSASMTVPFFPLPDTQHPNDSFGLMSDCPRFFFFF